MTGGGDEPARRRRQYRRGFRAEALAAWRYRCAGYRLLAKRFKSPVGEIDLVAVRRGRVAFVEVKRRATLAQCEAAVTPELRRRVRQAAQTWLGKNPKFQGHDAGFDLVFVVPWRLPLVLRDAL